MPSVEALSGTHLGRVSNACTNRLRRILRDLLAGLNELLKLSDFSRGDVFRD